MLFREGGKEGWSESVRGPPQRREIPQSAVYFVQLTKDKDPISPNFLEGLEVKL